MDAQIKQLTGNPTLYPSQCLPRAQSQQLTSTINVFVGRLRGAGKLTPNLWTRAAFFSFHLAHLRLGIEFSVHELIKKSSLTPANYNREFSIILKYCEQAEPVITADSVASFYGIGLEEIMEQLKVKKPPTEAEYWLAVLVAVSQAVKSANWLKPGSVAEVAKLWGQSAEGIKAFLPVIKDALKADECKAIIERSLKKRTSEKDTETANANASKTKATKRVKTDKDRSTSAFASEVHPLQTLSCSTIGPAFGPIILA